jgi:outer membrane autotransporter protein
MTPKDKFRGRLSAVPAVLLAGFVLCLPPAAPPARADEVIVDTNSSLRDKMNELVNGGTVSFTGDGLNNQIASIITLTSDPYVLNPGGAEHVTITGRGTMRVFQNTDTVNPDINLTLSNITITRGASSAVKSEAGNVNLTLAGDGTTELDGNTPGGSGGGGAVYGHTGVSITGSQRNLFITGNNADARAGALYSELGNVTIDTVLTGSLVIANNGANYTGGAIYAQGGPSATGTTTLSGTYGGILIRGNVSRGGGAGALGANGTLVINPFVSGEFLITSNTAGNGGALYAAGAMLITADGPAGIRIENNTATGNGAGLWLGSAPHYITANSPAGIRIENNAAAGSGGGIYMNNGGMPLNLDAAAGDIVFRGNTHGAAKTPNAIHANSPGGNPLNITGARNVLFFDPVVSLGADASPISKTGPGAVLFSGSSVWRGDVNVGAGSLLVNDGALLDTAAPGKSLVLAPGAILGTYADAGSGTIKAAALNLSGILYATGSASRLHLSGQATLNAVTIAADAHNDNQSGLTVVHDTAVFAGTGVIDLQSIAAASGTFDVFRYEAGVIPAAAFSATLRYQGNAVGGSGAARVSGSVQLAADGKTLRVILPGVISDRVTWTGAAGPGWDLSSENWKLNAIAATAAIGDYITFDDTAVSGDVTIEGVRLSISAMAVSNPALDYTFAGSGGVHATAAAIGGSIISPGEPGIGKLVKTGAGRLAFANAGANLFENGVEWHDGAIAITNGNQLGVGAGAAITLHAAGGTLQAAAAAAGTLASGITFAAGAARTLTVENTGAALDLAGVITGAGGIVITGSGLTALTGANTFTGAVTLAQGGALALAADSGLGAAANTLVIAGDARLVATGSFATRRALDLAGRTLEISTTGAGELALDGAAAQLDGSGTLRLSGRLHAAAAGVLGATPDWDITAGGRLALTGAQAVASLRNNGALQFRARGGTLTAASLSGTGSIQMELDFAPGAANSLLVITGEAGGRHRLELAATGKPADPRLVDIPLVTFASGDAQFSSNSVTVGRNTYEARQDGGNVNFVFVRNSASAEVIDLTAGALGMDWHYSLDSLRLRLGEVRGAVSPSGLITGSGDQQGAMGDVWFRTNVYRVEIEPGALGDNSAAFDQTSYDLSAGVDRAFALRDASLLLGGFATMSRTRRDHAISDSESTSDGVGAGLYGSWLAKSGWHLDLVAKYHRYTNTIDAKDDERVVTRGDYGSTACGFSAELGRRLARKRLWAEASAQAALAWFAAGEYTATSTRGNNTKTVVRVDRMTSLQARGQLRAGADLGRWQPYARLAGVYNTTDGGTLRTSYDPSEPPYESKPDFSGARFEAGAGVTLMVDERTLLYLDYEYDKAASYSRPWSVGIGLRRTW